jgi:hypothetical protein
MRSPDWGSGPGFDGFEGVSVTDQVVASLSMNPAGTVLLGQRQLPVE